MDERSSLSVTSAASEAQAILNCMWTIGQALSGATERRRHGLASRSSQLQIAVERGGQGDLVREAKLLSK